MGIGGEVPTYSQATKTMRILSALMNYAMADELIGIFEKTTLNETLITLGPLAEWPNPSDHFP